MDKLNCTMNLGNYYTEDEIDFLKEYYPKMGSKWCFENLPDQRHSRNSITDFCKRKGIKFDFHPDFQGENYNLEDFKNPSTPNMAYYLGFIWGDGTLSKYSVSSRNVKVDSIHIYETIKDLARFRVKDFQDKNLNWKPALNISLGGKSLCDYLREMDYGEKSIKSPSKILSTIPVKLHRYFWLGFLDADGCITKNNMIFAGSYEQDWSDLEEFLKNLNCNYIITRVVSKNGNRSSNIAILSRYDCNRIGQYIYQDYEKNKIGLYRKYEKFVDIKSLCSRNGRGGNSSGFIGVFKRSISKGVFFDCNLNRKNNSVEVKSFTTAEEAAIFYDKLSVFCYGHRSFTNFPIENYLDLTQMSYEIPEYDGFLDLNWKKLDRNILTNKR